MWRTALVGFGSSAEYFHLVSLRRAGEFQVIAVFDPVLARRQVAVHLGIPHVFDIDALQSQLYALSIQILVVSSPNSTHTALANAGLEAGVAVIVEKPVCLTGSEFAALEHAAARCGTWLVPFHNRLYDADQTMVEAAVKSGRIGRVLRVDLTCTQWGPWQAYASPEFDPSWRSQRHYGGGVLNDWGPHLLHQCLRLLPAQPELVAAWAHASADTDVDAIVSLTLRAAQALARILISAGEATSPEKLRVVGETGCIVVRGTDMEGIVEINGVNGRDLTPYKNPPDGGNALYRLTHNALTHVGSDELALFNAEARSVYDLLDQARALIEGNPIAL